MQAFKVPIQSRFAQFSGIKRAYSQGPDAVRFINVNNPDASLASFGLYIGVGSRNETRETQGATHLLKQLAFKSTQTRPQLQVCRDLELLGANFTSTSSREYLYFSGSIPRGVDNEMYLLNHLHELTQPKLSHWEVRDQKAFVQEETEHAQRDLMTSLSENLHKLAFRGVGLGQSQYAPLHNIDNLNENVLREWVNAHYLTGNIVVAYTGVTDAEKIEKVGRELFSSVRKGVTTAQPQQYKAFGEHLEDVGGDTHVAVGFKGVGLKSEEHFSYAVLEQLLGGGGWTNTGVIDTEGSLLSGVVNKNSWALSASTLSASYQETGLFGLYGRSSSGHANQMIEALVSQLVSVAEGKVNDSDVKSAKRATLRASLVALQDDPELRLRVASSDLISEGRLSNVSKEIEKVSKESIVKAATNVLQSKPNLVVYGDLSNVYTSNEVSRL